MTHGEICARHYATREVVCLRWKAGIITAVDPVSQSVPERVWLAPPLVDLQINGFGGVDFQQDNLPADALLAATRRLRADGCTRFLLTLMTDEWPRILARLKHLRELRDRSGELQAAIAGWHVEGPFLSAEPGYCGAHDPALMVNPTPRHIRQLRQVTGDDPVLLTMGPKRSDAIACMALAASLGIKVSLGHTNAPRRRLEQAVKAGATGFTHLGNGCPTELNRHDNILWRVFETPGLMVSLIPDGVHVSPTLFRLIHRVLGADWLYYVSDAMAASGAPPGRYRLGRLELEVGEDRTVRLPGTQSLAGSALTPQQGLLRATNMLRCAWLDVWPRFSDVPARFMGLPPGLAVGQPADFCLVEGGSDRAFESLRVYARGKPVAAPAD